MKLFISQPMNGLPEENIIGERLYLQRQMQLEYSQETLELLPMVTAITEEDAPITKRVALAYLGKSLMLLSQADVAVFASGWEDHRGCRIEHACCVEYGIPLKEY